jgi:hypothetical protein
MADRLTELEHRVLALEQTIEKYVDKRFVICKDNLGNVTWEENKDDRHKKDPG